MSKQKFYLGIKNEASSNVLELYFTDYIYDSCDWYSGETTNMVQDTIDRVKAANPTEIKVTINSLGGDVMIGLAIYNFLKTFNAAVTTDNISFSASIATIMQMAADKGKRRMAKNAFMIIHAAWGVAVGNADEMKIQADNLQKVTDQLAEIYAAASGKHDAAFFKNLWKDGDYWMTGDEALEIGLVDELYNAEPVMAKVDISQYGFKNVPAAVLNAKADGKEDKNFFTNLKAEFMKLIDSLKAAVRSGKEDKGNDKVENRDAILDMVEKVLAPFAAAVDARLSDAKPKAETEKPDGEKKEETTGGEKKDDKIPGEGDKKEDTKKEEGEEDLKALIVAQNKTIENLTLSIAAAMSKPKNDRSGEANASDIAQIEHEK